MGTLTHKTEVDRKLGDVRIAIGDCKNPVDQECGMKSPLACKSHWRAALATTMTSKVSH